MFSDVQADSDSRIVEIRDYVDFLTLNHPNPPSAIPRHINCAKGLVYVQLYGIMENTVIKTITKTIDLINIENIQISRLKPSLMALAADNELNALISSISKKWDKRNDLFSKLASNGLCSIANTLLPTDGKNIGESQLHSIWKTFEIAAPIFYDIKFSSRLKDIVLNRINYCTWQYCGLGCWETSHPRGTPSQIKRSLSILFIFHFDI